MRGSAEVVTGLRNTRDDMVERDRLNQGRGAKSRNDLIYGLVRKKFVAEKQAQVEAGLAKPVTPYDVIFQSKYRKHRVQVTSPADRLDPSTGILIRARPIAARFEDGIYRIPRQLDRKDADFVLERLRQHPNYGIGRDFWEQADMIDEGKIKATADSIALLQSNPDIRQSVLEVLESTDFDLDDRQIPPADPAMRQRTVTPKAEPRPAQAVLAPSDMDDLRQPASPPVATPPPEWKLPAPARAAKKKASKRK